MASSLFQLTLQGIKNGKAWNRMKWDGGGGCVMCINKLDIIFPVIIMHAFFYPITKKKKNKLRIY